MTDLQSTHKDFLFEIEEVGIKKNLVYPVLVDQYQTAGTFSFSTSLTKTKKGINMSCIIESVENTMIMVLNLNLIHFIRCYALTKRIWKQNAAGVDVLGNGS